MSGFSFRYLDHEFSIAVKPWSGEEWVSVDAVLVSHKRHFSPSSEHEFLVKNLGKLRLVFALDLPSHQVAYQLYVDDNLVTQAQAPLVPAHESVPEGLVEGDQVAVSASAPAHQPRQGSWISIGLVALKLLKTLNVIKVALLASSVAVYSVMFTFEFALALIAVLVFHEYGHLRAMKKFGIPTKGMYLIPFVGGLAVGDAPKTQWQDVYISMMGPVFGLAMTLVFYIAYLVTESHFAGLVASTSALINLFNLIPVYPLDGGRVVKALVFSGRNYWALVALLTISAACFAAAWKLGLYFITFFIVLGVIDIIASWRIGLANDITPLKRYGIWFSVLWYLLVVSLFIGMILMIAQDGLPGSEIATKVLSS